MFLLGVVVVILLFSKGLTLFNPQGKAEASTLKALDDIIIKTDTSAFEAGQPVIAYGYVDKDAAIIGFSSGVSKVGKVARPPQCGSRLNSCICAFKIGYEGLLGGTIKSEKVLKCKGFHKSEVSSIKGSTDDERINNKYQADNGFDFAIIGGAGASFTSTMTLSGEGLLSIESKITRQLEIAKA